MPQPVVTLPTPTSTSSSSPSLWPTRKTFSRLSHAGMPSKTLPKLEFLLSKFTINVINHIGKVDTHAFQINLGVLQADTLSKGFSRVKRHAKQFDSHHVLLRHVSNATPQNLKERDGRRQEPWSSDSSSTSFSTIVRLASRLETEIYTSQ